MRRVVITGLGLVTPLGANVKTTWDKLIANKSGIRKIETESFDCSDLATKIAGVIPLAHEEGGFELDKFVEPKDQRKMDKFIHYAIAAANEAVTDSGWVAITEEQKIRTGVLIGSGIGGLQTIANNAIALQEKGPKRISPFFIPASLINLAAGYVSIQYGFKGPNHAVVTACATGTHAIGDAARIIAEDDADIMVAGGSESSVNRLGIAGFNACRALATNFNDSPHRASRPWDKRRNGFVMGEGAGIVMLEEYEHAKRRGAKIYAEIIGYGLSGDAYHITAPADSGDGGYRSMEMALKKAKISRNEIDYINAHGTSTSIGDMIELNAVKRFFQDNMKNIAMSSTKSSIGHLLGAAGAVEAIFSVLAIQNNILPATLNLDEPSEGCEGVDLVPHFARESKVNVVLSNSFGFGGTNASLIIKRV